MLLSGIFIVAGVSHLLHPDKVANRINNAVLKNTATFFGDPYILGIITGYVLLLFGTALLLGIYTRIAAIALFGVLIPITITIQMGNGIVHGPLWKNIALFGGILFFIINNPKEYSMYNK
jgi:putative oxidoreductase